MFELKGMIVQKSKISKSSDNLFLYLIPIIEVITFLYKTLDVLVIETFEFEEAYLPNDPIQKIFDNSLSQYLTAFMQGFSLSVFAFGASEAGKTQTIEGNAKEPGLILMFSDALFNVMENKKYHTNNAQGQIDNFSYNIRVRYVEILDEEIKDLLPGGQHEGLTVVNNEWEGPTILGANWVSVKNAVELKDLLVKSQKNRTIASNEFGKLTYKSTGYFTIELIQNTELANRKESIFMVSRLNFLDLPGNFHANLSSHYILNRL